jgi:lipopolysaccharide/colanic/teichoic acid biosynthesis glycosyltransferase
LKLDEIPQLWNVLKGEMSIVGPRPEISRYVNQFPQECRVILMVRPGMAGNAIVTFCDEEEQLGEYPSVEDAYLRVILPQKLAIWQEYAGNVRFGRDARIFCRTVRKILRR